MQLSDLESKLERTRKEGLLMAEHLRAIADALAPEEGYILEPVLFANDEVFSIAGHRGEGITQMVGSKQFPASKWPNVKGIVKQIYDLTIEIERVKQSLKDAEQEARRAEAFD
ncbi:MAG: hypothetical protein OXN19_10780 [Caldilineaceae bacterium]|nr:hypothetical protein [Caldilineaceae bacterium]